MKDHGPALCRLILAIAIPVVTLPAGADTASRSASGPVTAGKPAPAANTAQPAPSPSMDNAAREREEVLKAFDTWLRAWNAKDADAYIAMYAKNFQPANGEARSAWERGRRLRIVNKTYINVRAEAPDVTINQDRATVRFVQIYLSDRLRDESRKILRFAKTAGKWQIIEERAEPSASGSARAA
jgi:hypothetical protein